jgi:hypothetical protein
VSAYQSIVSEFSVMLISPPLSGALHHPIQDPLLVYLKRLPESSDVQTFKTLLESVAARLVSGFPNVFACFVT